MKDNEKELVDFDEEGNAKEENQEKEPEKKNNSFKILATIIILFIIICAVIAIFKQYKRTNHIELTCQKKQLILLLTS